MLDGQQRLTSIYLGLKGKYYKGKKEKPDARLLYVNLVKSIGDSASRIGEDDEERFEFSFLTEKEARNDSDHYWYQVGKVLDYKDYGLPDSKNAIRDYTESNLANYTPDQQQNARTILEMLSNVINEKDDVLQYYNDRNKDIEKVMQVFVRVNSGGGHHCHILTCYYQ